MNKWSLPQPSIVMMDAMYAGFYINLSSNQRRREALISRLKALGGEQRYERVEAVDGRAIADQYTTSLEPGNLGLWLTHVNIIRSQQNSPLPLHILEDDTALADNAVELFDQMLVNASANLPDWDVIFTDVAVSLDSQLFSMLSGAIQRYRQNRAMSVIPLSRIPQFAGTGSLFIRRESLAKYLQLMEGRWEENLPIDLYLQKLVSLGKLNAYVTLPFLSSPTVQSEQSDIRGALSPSQRVMNLYRQTFYKDADLKSINTQLQQLLSGARIDPLCSIFLNATAFIFSDKWEPYR